MCYDVIFPTECCFKEMSHLNCLRRDTCSLAYWRSNIVLCWCCFPVFSLADISCNAASRRHGAGRSDPMCRYGRGGGGRWHLPRNACSGYLTFSCVSRVERMNLVHRAVVRTLDADSVAPGLRQVLLGPLSSRLSMLCLFDSFLCNLEIANISISSSFPEEGKLHSSLIRGTVMMSLPCTENILSTVLCLMHESYGSPLGFTADP